MSKAFVMYKASCTNTDMLGKKTLQTDYTRHETKPLTWVTGFYNTELTEVQSSRILASSDGIIDYDKALEYFKEKFPNASFDQTGYIPSIARIAITFADEADEAVFIIQESFQ